MHAPLFKIIEAKIPEVGLGEKNVARALSVIYQPQGEERIGGIALCLFGWGGGEGAATKWGKNWWGKKLVVSGFQRGETPRFNFC